jgi:biotin carboxyl carrier protein
VDLEAMKMVNEVRSPRDGLVAAVGVQVGDRVGHGHCLLTFEERG